MTKIFPLRFKAFGENFLFSNDAGLSFIASKSFLERYVNDALTEGDEDFLSDNGHSFHSEFDLRYLSHLKGLVSRFAFKKQLSYLVLVPTLRCNLSCSYCQVSRVGVDKTGFDWNDDILTSVLDLLDSLQTNYIKIEFQGGEPLLRPDLIVQVIDFCEQKFLHTEFVICTNLSMIDETVSKNFYIQSS